MFFKKLDEIINRIADVIDQSKTEIFEIAEMARAEYARVESQLLEVRKATEQVIRQVDAKERQFRQARVHLMEVSRAFRSHSETAIRHAYEDAQVAQLELFVLKEREAQLRAQRDELERSLRNLQATVERADRLATQVGVAMQYLRDSLHDLDGQLDGIQQRQQLGVRVIKAQEEERRRVARDIHDGPAQTLASVVLRAEICEKLLDADTEQVRQELRNLKDLVRASLQDIRKIIYDLRPMALDDLGLVPTLRRFVMEFNKRSTTNVEFVVIGYEKRLPAHVEVGVFRIVQEALNNISQHAHAQNAIVKVEFETKALGVLIKDDGCGFDVTETLHREGDHFGLLSMRERAELLQGTWQISSASGQGTRILVRVPIKEAD
ncbi:MAG: histidine kinase [Firmicutes bacterium]|nr:histidine kinase [Bacillota bacterium]